MSNLSDNLKKLRTDNKLTQQQLADKLHVSQNAIYNWENGKREPSLKTINDIAEIFGVSQKELLSFEDGFHLWNKSSHSKFILLDWLENDQTIIQDVQLNDENGLPFGTSGKTFNFNGEEIEYFLTDEQIYSLDEITREQVKAAIRILSRQNKEILTT